MQADSGIYVEDEQVEVAAVKAVSTAGRWTAVKPVSTTAPRRGSLNKQDRKQSQATIHEAFEKANDPRLLFNSVDEDHSGNIDFEEVRRHVAATLPAPRAERASRIPPFASSASSTTRFASTRRTRR